MWGIFKTDPVKKLQKEHAAILSEAHRMGSIDRAKSDELVAKAAKVEERLVQMMGDRS
tara:strand:- start:421 stop:594 length:174 start_codon:yes stop_codon:yes gene_type:complete